MTHDHDELSQRPERVIILDADNPMVEIHGQFVWRDEHERVLAEVRDRAYADGYEAGRLASTGPVEIRIRRRRSLVDYAWLVMLGLGVLFVILMMPVVFL
jgi:hypothetical protein